MIINAFQSMNLRYSLNEMTFGFFSRLHGAVKRLLLHVGRTFGIEHFLMFEIFFVLCQGFL
jgi:hypothetical protein